MKLIVLTAVIAVCGAAKLDRSYLPPPSSAKTAGGSPGSLQIPFSSHNQGLGGLPKGSFTNEFHGVVVDAAAAGTRSSESGGTGLGEPRRSYGSQDSKVGSAAFKIGGGYNQGNVDDEITEGSADAFLRKPSSFGSQNNGHVTSNAASHFGNNQANAAFRNVEERPQASLERAANTLRFNSEVGKENFNYAFETDNGITAEENGVAANGVQAQGGFSYTGDNGQVYSVSYTADEGGYQPHGDHLPTPPPIPEEILKSLEQNAKDEAAGIIDDGSYDAKKYNDGGDYSDSNADNGQYNHGSPGHGSSAIASAQAIGQQPSHHHLSSIHGGQISGATGNQGNFNQRGISGQGNERAHGTTANSFSGHPAQGSGLSSHSEASFQGTGLRVSNIGTQQQHANNNQNDFSRYTGGSHGVSSTASSNLANSHGHGGQGLTSQENAFNGQTLNQQPASTNHALASVGHGQTISSATSFNNEGFIPDTTGASSSQTGFIGNQNNQQQFGNHRPAQTIHNANQDAKSTQVFGKKNEYLPPTGNQQNGFPSHSQHEITQSTEHATFSANHEKSHLGDQHSGQKQLDQNSQSNSFQQVNQPGLKQTNANSFASFNTQSHLQPGTNSLIHIPGNSATSTNGNIPTNQGLTSSRFNTQSNGNFDSSAQFAGSSNGAPGIGGQGPTSHPFGGTSTVAQTISGHPSGHIGGSSSFAHSSTGQTFAPIHSSRFTPTQSNNGQANGQHGGPSSFTTAPFGSVSTLAHSTSSNELISQQHRNSPISSPFNSASTIAQSGSGQTNHFGGSSFGSQNGFGQGPTTSPFSGTTAIAESVSGHDSTLDFGIKPTSHSHTERVSSSPFSSTTSVSQQNGQGSQSVEPNSANSFASFNTHHSNKPQSGFVSPSQFNSASAVTQSVSGSQQTTPSPHFVPLSHGAQLPFGHGSTSSPYSSASSVSQSLSDSVHSTAQSSFNTQPLSNIHGINSNSQYQQNQFNAAIKPDNRFAQTTEGTVFNKQTGASSLVSSSGTHNDDSYFYNQPLKPFNTPLTQQSGVHSTSPSQFNGQFSGSQSVPQVNPSLTVSDFHNQHHIQSFNPQPTASSFPSRNPQTSAQSSVQQLNSQNTASSFPTRSPQTPAQSSVQQFNSQHTGLSFLPRNPQTSAQSTAQHFNSQHTGSSFPTINPQTSAQSTAQFHSQGIQKQTTAIPQAFQPLSQQPLSNHNDDQTNEKHEPIASSQSPSFIASSHSGFSHQGATASSIASSVPSQQYDGEIYEYNKPPESLPAPSHKDQDGSSTRISSQHSFSNVQQPQFRPNGPSNQFTAQNVAGKGEVFGGPRKPPSFDSQTGYHY